MGNSMNPSSNVSLSHFQQTFPSLAFYINDESTFSEIFDLVQSTCEFLESRNMDCKDRVYTKRVKEMQLRVREIVKRRSNVLVRKMSDIDMIIDYMAYACIYGEDVAPSSGGFGQGGASMTGQKALLYDWSKLVRDVPERCLKGHVKIQQELEKGGGRVWQGWLEVGEEKAREEGWDSLAQMEYFSNIDRYEDLSFADQNNVGQLGTGVLGQQVALQDCGGSQAVIEVSRPVLEQEQRVREKPMEKPLAQTLCNRENCVIAEIDDDDFEAEDGASPALLGGYIVPACQGDDVDIDKGIGHYKLLNGAAAEEM